MLGIERDNSGLVAIFILSGHMTWDFLTDRVHTEEIQKLTGCWDSPVVQPRSLNCMQGWWIGEWLGAILCRDVHLLEDVTK